MKPFNRWLHFFCVERSEDHGAAAIRFDKHSSAFDHGGHATGVVIGSRRTGNGVVVRTNQHRWGVR